MSNSFVHPYMPNTAPQNRQAMLDALEIKDVSDLYGKSIPQDLRYHGTTDIPAPILGEYALKRHVTEIINKNTSCEEYTSFLGGGCYDHYVPAICDEINMRSEFLTAYCGDTYSDHGKMQAIFEYASLMAELLDMDVVSYTMYDGGQAVCSALRMAVRIQEASDHAERRIVLVPSTMNLEIFSQLRNYCRYAATVRTVACNEDGRIDMEDLNEKLSIGNVAAVFIENPSYLGFWEEQAVQIGKAAHNACALFVVQPEVASLGIAKPPVQYGADIVCGDIQPLGMHMQFGGGCAGFIATKYEGKYIQEFPTYLYGIARTKNKGEFGWGRALNYRCSHNSREKAKEYFGTETGLWSITAAVYLSLMGPEGMRELGAYIANICNYAIRTLAKIPGIKANKLGGANFQEFVVDFSGCGKTVREINAALLEKHIFGGKDLSCEFEFLGQSALYCVTEKTTRAQVDILADALASIVKEDI